MFSPDWKKNNSERLASLGIVGDWLRLPLNPLNTIVTWCPEGFQGGLIWAFMMPRDSSLSDSWTSDRWCLSSQVCILAMILSHFLNKEMIYEHIFLSTNNEYKIDHISKTKNNKKKQLKSWKIRYRKLSNFWDKFF